MPAPDREPLPAVSIIFRWEDKVMMEKGNALDILKSALALSKGDMTEAVLENNRLSLTRFAESKIHQNIDTEDTTLYLRTVKDKKITVVATGDISPEGIKKAVGDSGAMMTYSQPDDKFVSFPKPDGISLTEDYLSGGTTAYSPQMRAEAVQKIAGISRKGNLDASGAFRIEAKSLAVCNSLGMEKFFAGNNAQLSMTLSGKDNNSGWSAAFNPNAAQINIDALALTAAEKAMMSRNAVALPDGQYTVILEPAAVGQLLLMLAFMGFGCKTLYEHRSFMTDKIGQKIAGDNFTVYEDPFDSSFKGQPFDYEGVGKVKVPLVENGIAKGVVYNSYYAGLMGTTSTGNALPPNNSFGPYPKNMVVAPGTDNIEEMIKSTEKGILITHFWYINYLNPTKTMVTGTTRDGTFLIEGGKMTSAVKTMRTNQSILEAFSNIAAVSKGEIVYPQYSVLMKVPAMKINNFNLAAEEEETNKC